MTEVPLIDELRALAQLAHDHGMREAAALLDQCLAQMNFLLFEPGSGQADTPGNAEDASTTSHPKLASVIQLRMPRLHHESALGGASNTRSTSTGPLEASLQPTHMDAVARLQSTMRHALRALAAHDVTMARQLLVDALGS